jgi:hypothetical protein
MPRSGRTLKRNVRGSNPRAGTGTTLRDHFALKPVGDRRPGARWSRARPRCAVGQVAAHCRPDAPQVPPDLLLEV